MQFSCFPILPGSAEAHVIRGGIVKRLLIAYFPMAPFFCEPCTSAATTTTTTTTTVITSASVVVIIFHVSLNRNRKFVHVRK